MSESLATLETRFSDRQIVRHLLNLSLSWLSEEITVSRMPESVSVGHRRQSLFFIVWSVPSTLLIRADLRHQSWYPMQAVCDRLAPGHRRSHNTETNSPKTLPFLDSLQTWETQIPRLLWYMTAIKTTENVWSICNLFCFKANSKLFYLDTQTAKERLFNEIKIVAKSLPKCFDCRQVLSVR